jgi:hypothetical protein
MNLEEKLYTSTEVAEILGVSLRSVYRYLEQDKLDAEIKTATGRLRFTKQNITDFLYPEGDDSSSDKSKSAKSTSSDKAAEPVEETPQEGEGVGAEAPDEAVVEETPQEPEPEPEEEEAEDQGEKEPEEEIDWLERFRAAAKEYSPEESESQETQEQASQEQEQQKEGLSSLTSDEPNEDEEPPYKYYKSMVGGLKEIAQSIDKVARKSNVDYAFTLYAGLSLERPLKKPFSVLHVYIDEESEPLFRRMLQLEESDEDNAQLCLMFPRNGRVFADKDEKHGLYVVSSDCMAEDFEFMGLAEEFAELS